MALGPKQMREAIIKNLKTKTGKNLEEWIVILSDSEYTDKKDSISYLKNEHGLGHFQAKTIFEQANAINQYENVYAFPDQIFDTQKSKTLYDFAKENILAYADDIKIQPCQTYIPFYRKTQFAILAKNKNGLLLGLNLPADHNYEKFTRSSSKGSERINAQIIIKNTIDWDIEVTEAVQTAYNNN